MKRCLSCHKHFASSLSDCSACGARPEIIDGFQSYAPGLAHSGGGFKADYFSELARLEENNFWFSSRNKLIIWALGKYCPDFKSYLEIGCGTGYVFSGVVEAYPGVEFHGSEIFTSGLVFASARQPKIKFMQMDARNIPFVDEFDTVGAFDVLEHITEDDVVLKQMHDAIQVGGTIILTVPQHRFLWSEQDEYACHVRRYSRDELMGKVRQAGFEVVSITSFVFFLLPLMIGVRFLKRNRKPLDPAEELKLSRLTNWFLGKIMAIERLLIQAGGRFPIGGSLLLVGRKTGNNAG